MRGQVFLIDEMAAFLATIIAITLVFSFFNTASTEIGEYRRSEYLKRKALAVSDMVVLSPGMDHNRNVDWERAGFLPVYPGLAQYSPISREVTPNILSRTKIDFLKESEPDSPFIVIEDMEGNVIEHFGSEKEDMVVVKRLALLEGRRVAVRVGVSG